MLLDDFHILLVEDSPSDVKIIERALAEHPRRHRLTVLRDGWQTLRFLDRLRDPSTRAELIPDLILLDLNLPGLDGGQVLQRIKSDPELKPLPVVVLTTSQREEDIWQTYQAGANSYIVKPAEFAEYRELVANLHAYWHDTALRPAPFCARTSRNIMLFRDRLATTAARRGACRSPRRRA